MLNIFPSLLDFSILAPVLIRLAIGLLFIRYGAHKLSSEKRDMYREKIAPQSHISNTSLIATGLLEVVGGCLLVVGLWTQAASLVLLCVVITVIFLKKQNKIYTPFSYDLYVLVVVTLLSLMVLGAGVFAIDIPL